MHTKLSYIALCFLFSTLHPAASSSSAAASSASSDINARSGEFQRTQLMDAAFTGKKETVAQLMIQDADPYAKDSEGFTALQMAAFKGDHDAVQLLIMFSPDKKKLLSDRHKDGWPIFKFAQKTKNVAVIRELNRAYDTYVLGTSLPQTYFSPGILPLVCKLINEERESIRVSQYCFTHGDPARAMAAKQAAGVPTELMVDKGYKRYFCIALKHLVQNGVSVFSVETGSDGRATSFCNMHHKFYLFGHNSTHQRPLLINGSCNNTGQAYASNWESAEIIDDPSSIDAFKAEYARLKRIAIPLTAAQCVSREKDSKDDSYYPKKLNKVRSYDFR